MRAALSCLALLALVLAGCTGTPPPPAPGNTTGGTGGTGGNTTGGGTPGAKPDCAALEQDAKGTAAGHTRVQVETNLGTFKVELFDDAAPKTAANFKMYAQDGFFDHVVLHRIVKGFMAQGGKFDNTTKQAKEPTHGPIVNEAASSGCLNRAYTLSMARTQDPNSAQTEFFTNFVDNSFLDPSPQSGAGYAVFGIVYQGRDVVDRIQNVPVHFYKPGTDRMCQGGDQGPNCPDQPVEMVRVSVV
ncbi:MAG: peptidylprolyl isomerase [Halobacteriales archaeon]|nr:peptidylprolyl isomerase [Halobacteriales archaeon]